MQNGIERGNLKWSSAGLDDQRVVNRFPANLLTVCSEGEHFNRCAARFREQDEASFNPGDPEGRSRFVGEFDTAHRSGRDPEHRDMALGVGVTPRARIEEMQRGVAEFRRAFEAHADTGAAEFEVQAAGRADVGIELVAAGSERRRCPSTFRAVPNSHGNGSSGSASRRRQAMRKVSDTISSATSRPSVRRRT